MSHFVSAVGHRTSGNAQMLVKYETCPQSDFNSVPRERMKFCSRPVVFFCVLLCVLLIYLPTFYPPGFTKKTFDVLVDGWGVNASRSMPLYIVPYNETAVIADRSSCAERLRLLIIVCSSVVNFLERITIRETWGNFSSPDYKVVFLLGLTDNVTIQSTVEAESLIYKDIIQEGFIDSYNNLTLKSVMLLKQVVGHCQHADFVLKCDDDMFVHVMNLLKLIHHLQDLSMKNVLLGELICDAKPIQDTSSKWYSPSYMFSGKVYPRYLSGTGYLMDRSAAVRLYVAALETPFFHLEDVYITGFCAEKADVKPRDHVGFSYQTRPLDPCLYISNKYVITSHRVSPEKMRQLWVGLNKNKTCPTTDFRQLRLRSSRLMPPLRRNSRC